jgi:putative oxygen-independent coproporphyrinogen III oxidase
MVVAKSPSQCMTDRPAANREFHPSTATGPESHLGIYIHFPWCLSKCAYCDFTSVPTACSEIPHRVYAQKIIAELRARLHSLSPRRLTSVYFGGGTPSLWDPTQIHQILDSVKTAWGNAPQPVEITLECNPSSFTKSTSVDLLAAGINRISLGIQSLCDPVLRALGRRHTRREALAALELSLATGFENTGADLLFAIPGNTLSAELRDARTLASLGITHLSCYALTIEPNTELGRRIAQEGLCPASGPRVARTFQALHTALGALGLQHYEISNYARPSYHSVHNQGYWRGHDYLGLGVGATGTITEGLSSVRYRNPTRIADYLGLDFLDPCRLRDEHTTAEHGSGLTHTTAEHGIGLTQTSAELGIGLTHTTAEHGIGLTQTSAEHGIELEPLTPEIRLVERFMLALRTEEGINLESVRKELGLDALPPSQNAAIQRLLASGRLVETAGRLAIPNSLWHLSDGIIRQLM